MPDVAETLRRAAQGTAGVLVGALIAEALVRWGSPGDVHLPIYTEIDGAIALGTNTSAVGRLTSGRTYRVSIDEHGLRAPTPPHYDTLLVGDSGAFGVGLDDDQTLAATLTRLGLPTANAGVPAFSVPDAIAHAAHFPSERAIVLVNPADDQIPMDWTADVRFDVVDGWLVSADTPAAVRAFLRSPAADSRILLRAVSTLNLFRSGAEARDTHWSGLPDGGASRFTDVGRAIRTFARSREVCVVWMPLDATHAPGRSHPSPLARMEGDFDDTRALNGLVTGLGNTRLVLPEADPEMWLDGDVHLSSRGVTTVARAILDDCF